MNKLREFLKQDKKRAEINNEWYSLRSILGYDWAIFYFLLGGREAGKSYAVTHFFVHQWREYGRPFYWLRLSDESCKKLLKNNVRDPRAFVDVKELAKFKKYIEKFQIYAKNNVKHAASKSIKLRCFTILANIGLSSFLLAYCLPKAQFLFRELVTGSKYEPGLI